MTRSKLANLATLMACIGALAVPAASAAAQPSLCETSCGGSWGAREHARASAEQHGFSSISITKCNKNSEFGAQWYCRGTGNHGSEHYWEVWMDAYGNQTQWFES